MVSLHELVGSQAFEDQAAQLPIILGKNIAGDPVVADRGHGDLAARDAGGQDAARAGLVAQVAAFHRGLQQPAEGVVVEQQSQDGQGRVARDQGGVSG